MAGRISAFDRTLVGNHVHSEEGVLSSNPTIPTLLPKAFAARWQLLRNAPSKGDHSGYIALFFKSTYAVVGFFELMRMSYAALQHFLRYLQGNLSLSPWSYYLDQLVLQGGVRKVTTMSSWGARSRLKPPLILQK